MKAKLYQHFARRLGAIKNCKSHSNSETALERHVEALEKLSELLPSGSGFDSGTELLQPESTQDRLVFSANFHHIDEGGYYCGWSEHTVIVTPSLVFGFTLKVTGRDKRNIKDYIADTFHHVLSGEYELSLEGVYKPCE
jgi:hypothetical protein